MTVSVTFTIVVALSSLLLVLVTAFVVTRMWRKVEQGTALGISEFEQTPIEELDPNNILGRQGIAKFKSMSVNGSSQSQRVFEPSKGEKSASSVDVVSPLVGESVNAKREG